MEDAATAEISRSQIWQWMRSPKGVLEDGRQVTAKLFEKITTDDQYVEFLTLPAYQLID